MATGWGDKMNTSIDWVRMLFGGNLRWRCRPLCGIVFFTRTGYGVSSSYNLAQIYSRIKHFAHIKLLVGYTAVQIVAVEQVEMSD
jgi:hypothetical protein